MSKGALSLVSPLYAATRKTPKAPAGYQPTWQAGADQGFQTTVQDSMPWASQLPSSVIPQFQDLVGQVQNNPYYPGAQAGAEGVAALAGNTVAPRMFDAAEGLYGQGMLSMGAGLPMMDQLKYGGDTSFQQGQVLSGRATDLMNPAVIAAFKAAPGVLQSGMGKANDAWQASMGAIPYLTGGMPEAQQLLETGFDPQGALYDREFQKMQDQQNAINAMYGVSGSAYGAGVAGDSARNFNLDWQDRQLGRQLSALGGFGQHQASVTGNLTNLVNTGGNQYNNLSSGAVGNYNNLLSGATDRFGRLADTASTALNRGVDNQRLNYATGADIWSGLNRTGMDLLGGASAHGTDALNTLYTSSQLPSQTYLGNIDSQIAALNALTSGTTSALQPNMQILDALSNYMQLGQNATRNAQNATQMNNAQRAASMQGLTSMLGTIAGIAMAPATGGMSLFMSGASGMGGRG